MKTLKAVCVSDADTIYTQNEEIISIIKVQFDDTSRTCVVFTGQEAESAFIELRQFRIVSFNVSENPIITESVFKWIEQSELTEGETITFGSNFKRILLDDTCLVG